MEETCIIPNFNFDKDGKLAEALNRIFYFSKNIQNQNEFQQVNSSNSTELNLIKSNSFNSVNEFPDAVQTIKDVFVDKQGNSLVESIQIVSKEEVERQKKNAVFFF